MANKSKKVSTEKRCNLVSVNGVRMPTQERNLMMKLDYINGGYSLQDVADKYGLTYDLVANISSREKWGKEKKEHQKRIEQAYKHKTTEIYASCAVDITIQHNNTWQKILNIINEVLNDPDRYLKTAEGKYKLGLIDLLADTLTKVQAGQNLSNGFVSKLDRMKIDLARERYELARRKAGEDDDEEEVVDNFVDALTVAAKSVWGDNDEDEKSEE